MVFFFFHAVVDLAEFAHCAECCCYAGCLKGEFCYFKTEMETERFMFVAHS